MAKKTLEENDSKHGTVNGYTNYHCRCPDCTKAISDYKKAKSLKGLPLGDSRHGTNGYTNYGCRCDVCKASWTAATRESVRRKHLGRAYGLTPEQWEVKFDNQGRACASCGDEPKVDSKRRFHVDHNHTTGAVRGILCHSCNVALGHLKEDKQRIRALIDYIEAYEPF